MVNIHGVPNDSNSLSTSHYQCPFRGLDGCKNGAGGRWLGKAYLIQHLRDKHFVYGSENDRCRQRIASNHDICKAWEEVLSQLRMWLCTECMLLRAWRRPCNSHAGDGLLGPLNSNDVDLLINGIRCPPPTSVNIADDNVAPLLPCLDVELLNKVFLQHIQTIKNIPPKCKLQFSRVLKFALDKVCATPGEVSVWIQLLLLPVCNLHLYIPKSSSEEKSGNRRTLQIRSINQSIVQWYEPDGCIRLVQKLLLDYPKRINKQRSKNNNQEALNLSVCRKKIRNGLFNAAIKVLTSNGIATDEEDTLKILIDKHPFAPPPVVPSEPSVLSSVVSSNEIILGRIRSFPKGTSCGRDGLRVQHLLDSLNGPATVVSEDLLTSIKGVVNLWFDGRCPPQLGEFVASAPLTPLLKPDGGIRPIAVGTVWRRLVSKVAAQAVGKDMSTYLGCRSTVWRGSNLALCQQDFTSQG